MAKLGLCCVSTSMLLKVEFRLSISCSVSVTEMAVWHRGDGGED